MVPLQKSITVWALPSASFTGQVQVVQPRVWPGVRCAVRVTPPSDTVSPSLMMRSTLTGGNQARWLPSAPSMNPCSSARRSPSLAMKVAPVSRFSLAMPPAWSLWPWVLRMILMSASRKPSRPMRFSTTAASDGMPTSIRMSPAGVTIRKTPRPSLPT